MIRVLSVTFADRNPPPNIVSVKAVGMSSSISVVVLLDAAGAAACGAYTDDGQIPSSVDAIRLQNSFGLGINGVVAFNITGLIPSTKYSVYCVSYSSDGAKSSLAEALKTRMAVETACCRILSVKQSVSTVFVNASSLGAVTLSLLAAPESDLMISFSVSYLAKASVTAINLAVDRVLFPSSVKLTPQSSLVSQIAFLPQNRPGAYTVVVNSIPGYRITADSPILVNVIDADVPVPAPRLVGAAYSADATSIAVSLDSPSDKASLPLQFGCGALLLFEGASFATCSWSDERTVQIALSSKLRFSSASSVSLVSGVLKAQCRRPSGNCSDYPSANTNTVYVSVPEALLVAPKVFIAAPSIIGSCDDLVVDFSSSLGSYGRLWHSGGLAAVSECANVNETVAFLDTIPDLANAGRALIPRTVLEAGCSYRLTLTLCNFLGRCGSNTAAVAVSKSILPVVDIFGSPLRTTYRSSALSISGAAYVTDCDGKTSSKGLVYSWSVFSSDSASNAIISSASVDPKTFRLPAYSLASNVLYQFQLTAFNSESLRSASASVSVFVAPGKVVSVISGGFEQSIRSGRPLTLDGSGSMDEDQDRGKDQGLAFQWSCVQHAPAFSVSCDGIELTSASNSSSLSLVARKESRSVITLTVTGLGGRSASSTVQLSVLSTRAPDVRMLSGAIKINPSEKLSLRGFFASEEAGRGVWAMGDDAVLPVTEGALLTPVQIDCKVGGCSAGVSTNLVLAPNALYAGGSFTFKLTYFAESGVWSSAALSVLTNSAPSEGALVADRDRGLAFVTPFTFTSSQWFDVDLPLLYEYSYLEASALGTPSVIRSKMEAPFCTSLLPVGVPLIVRVQVFDSLAASSEGFTRVNVTTESAVNVSSIASSFVDELSGQSTNNDDLRRAVALVGSALNSADCSMALDCGALHRESCSVVDNTCGPCEAGYIGDGECSNTPCVQVAAGRRLQQSGINALSQCDGGEGCVSKACPGGCSGRGRCVFKSSKQASVDSCLLGDSTCDAVCRCDEGYSGVSCSMTSAAMDQRQRLREQLVAGVLRVMSREDASASSVSSWMNSLSSLARRPDELSSAARDTAAVIVDSILSSAAASPEIPVSALDGILTSVSALAWTTASGNSTADLAASNSVIASSVETVQRLVSMYAELVGSSMVLGESAITAQSSLFSVVTRRSDLTRGAVSLSPPVSALDALLGASPQVVTFPAAAIADGASAALSVVTSKASLFNSNGFNSEVVKLQYPSAMCSGGIEDCVVHIVIQNDHAVDFSPVIQTAGRRLVADESVNITCNGTSFKKLAVCPSGESIPVTCNESSVGTVVVACPVHRAQSVCNSVSGLSAYENSNCTVLSYSAYNTTCSCVLPRQTRPPSSGQSVQFVSMLKYTASDFRQTWDSADSLSAESVKRNWKVLVAVGITCLLALCITLWGNCADRKSAKELSSVVAISDQKLGNTQELIDRSLPDVLRETPLMKRLAREMKVYHRWFGVVFFYSPYFSRSTRVLSLLTSAVIMAFANAVVYNVAYPNDGSCRDYSTESACLRDKSSFSGESKCVWDPAGESCSFNEPASQMKQVVFVAVIAAVMSTPVSVFADYVIMNYIAADLKLKKSSIDRPPLVNRKTLSSRRVVSNIGSRDALSSIGVARRGAALGGSLMSNNAESIRQPMKTSPPSPLNVSSHSSAIERVRAKSVHGGLNTSLEEDMSSLVSSLRRYREEIDPESRRVFDGILLLMIIIR
jgi:hypothetical protein